MEKNEKDQLNKKERRNSRSLRSAEKEALQGRANSVKRAMYNVVEHSEPGRPKRYQRKLSITPFEALKLPTSSADASPCTSPLPGVIPPINIISPPITTNLLTIYPLGDNHRESLDENFFNTISLPVPRQFADSRRSSGVPESIQEIEEHSSNSIGILNESNKLEINFENLPVPLIIKDTMVDPLTDYRPIEVFERKYYMSFELNKEKHEGEKSSQEILQKHQPNSTCAASLHVPTEQSVPATTKEPRKCIGENLTIVDTDTAVSHKNIRV